MTTTLEHLEEPNYNLFLDGLADLAKEENWREVDDAVEEFDDHTVESEDYGDFFNTWLGYAEDATGRVTDMAHTVLARVEPFDQEGLDENLYNEVLEAVEEGITRDHEPAAFRASIASIVHGFHEDLEGMTETIYQNIVDFADSAPEIYEEATRYLFDRIGMDIDSNRDYKEESKKVLNEILN